MHRDQDDRVKWRDELQHLILFEQAFWCVHPDIVNKHVTSLMPMFPRRNIGPPTEMDQKL